MSRAQTFAAIRNGITDYREKGNTAVDVDKLLQYLDGLEGEMGEADEFSASSEEAIERLRAQFANQQLEYGWKKDFQLAQYNWRKDQSLEMFKSVITAGQNSMRAAMLIHGGSSIALLAFMGNLAVNPETLPLVPGFAGILPWFLGGLLLVVIAYGTAYLTQSVFSDDDREHFGQALESGVLRFGRCLLCCLCHRVLEGLSDTLRNGVMMALGTGIVLSSPSQKRPRRSSPFTSRKPSKPCGHGFRDLDGKNHLRSVEVGLRYQHRLTLNIAEPFSTFPEMLTISHQANGRYNNHLERKVYVEKVQDVVGRTFEIGDLVKLYG